MASLNIEGDGYGTALAGMRKTYARARAAMGAASDSPTPEAFHEWRKRVKYHCYHMRLLRESWPTIVRARQVEAEKLGESLGNHHDLGVLRSLILNDPVCFAEEVLLMNSIKLVDRWTG